MLFYCLNNNVITVLVWLFKSDTSFSQYDEKKHFEKSCQLYKVPVLKKKNKRKCNILP